MSLSPSDIKLVSLKEFQQLADELGWNEDDRPGTADAIRLLSQHDANPDAQDNNGCSPLIIAARESNCHEVVRALLEAAADRTLVDGEGKTAFMYARSETILRMLRGDIE